MTTTDLSDTQPVVVIDPEGRERIPPRRRPTRHDVVRRAVRFTVGLLVGLALAYWIFEGPVANLWYQTRQDHLASDFNVSRAHIKAGQAAAVIQIPTIGLNLTVGEGDSPGDLRSGPGHQPGTPLPGRMGNSVIFAHAHAWGGPFEALDKLHRDDVIYLEGQDKQTYLFAVKSVTRTSSEDLRPLAPSTDRRLTLVTAAGSRRLVVTAVSGRGGHVLPIPAHIGAAIPTGSLLFNRTVASLLLGIAATVGVVLVLRGNHRGSTVAAIATPVALWTVLALLLEADLLLSPLR